MSEPINLREPWPWHLVAWSVLILGLALRDEAAGGPAADPFLELIGFLMLGAGILGVVGVIGWELSRWTVRQ